MAEPEGVDLSPMHRELDTLKARLCRCDHRGECIACRGFEVLRQQVQMVAAAASQPVLMQVAQEAAIKDLLGQLGGAQEKLLGDPRLQELLGQLMERVQEDLGGPEAMKQMFGSLPGFGGQGNPFAGAGGEWPFPRDDRPPGGDDSPQGEDSPPEEPPAAPPGGGGAPRSR